MENYDAALPLMTETLERMRRLLGDDSANTLLAMRNLANLHAEMGRNDLALPLYRDALQRSRRVLGSRHPDTLNTMQSMGGLLCKLGDELGDDTAAGIELLEEVVAGQTAVLGADHPDTRYAQAVLDWVNSEDDDDDDDDEAEEEEEEETIATRVVHKRRRHA
jgi:hypothetical protein